MRIHPVFSPKLFRFCADNLLPEQKLPPPQFIEIEGKDEWAVLDILDFKKTRGRLKYKVQWEGYDRDDIWYDADGDEFANSSDIVKEFHRQYPNKSR